jgi:hypothetical protein
VAKVKRRIITAGRKRRLYMAHSLIFEAIVKRIVYLKKKCGRAEGFEPPDQGNATEAGEVSGYAIET